MTQPDGLSSIQIGEEEPVSKPFLECGGYPCRELEALREARPEAVTATSSA